MAAFKLKERISVGDSDPFLEAVRIIEVGKPRTFIPMLALFVESWEYAGDPTDPAAYEALDLFREYMPMVRQAEGRVAEMMGND